jgi:hypothetical protein
MIPMTVALQAIDESVSFYKTIQPRYFDKTINSDMFLIIFNYLDQNTSRPLDVIRKVLSFHLISSYEEQTLFLHLSCHYSIQPWLARSPPALLSSQVLSPQHESLWEAQAAV